MRLTTPCKGCGEAIKVKSDVGTRADLQMKKGTEFPVNCTSCGKQHTIHVNDVRAEMNYTLILITAMIIAIASVQAFFYVGIISTLGMSVVGIVWYQQMSLCRSFNLYLVRRRT